jgi:hypothetical protein
MSPLLDSRKSGKHQALTDSSPKTLSPSLSPEAQTDPDLAVVLDAWPMLPPALRAGIVAMVRAVKQ